MPSVLNDPGNIYTPPVPAAPAAPNLAQSQLGSDPSYLAFLRASNLSQATSAADVARRQAALQAALNLQLPGMEQQDATQGRNLAGNYEARGMFRSGAHLRDASELQAQQARQKTAFITNTQNQIADLSGQLASNIADQQRRSAEAGLTSAYNQTKAASASGYNG